MALLVACPACGASSPEFDARCRGCGALLPAASRVTERPPPLRFEGGPRAGDVLVERFEVERRAGSGGMGVVFRARDRHTGERVALKLLHAGDAAAFARFAREAAILAELRHPRIVRHVAHGVASSGQPYLAMEWI
ncbi:MAG TPA: protein kinase, partial [Minicystis sp.]|nr:protein kinase [Minicystis sp.]